MKWPELTWLLMCFCSLLLRPPPLWFLSRKHIFGGNLLLLQDYEETCAVRGETLVWIYWLTPNGFLFVQSSLDLWKHDISRCHVRLASKDNNVLFFSHVNTECTLSKRILWCWQSQRKPRRRVRGPYRSGPDSFVHLVVDSVSGAGDGLTLATFDITRCNTDELGTRRLPNSLLAASLISFSH